MGQCRGHTPQQRLQQNPALGRVLDGRHPHDAGGLWAGSATGFVRSAFEWKQEVGWTGQQLHGVVPGPPTRVRGRVWPRPVWALPGEPQFPHSHSGTVITYLPRVARRPDELMSFLAIAGYTRGTSGVSGRAESQGRVCSVL